MHPDDLHVRLLLLEAFEQRLGEHEIVLSAAAGEVESADAASKAGKRDGLVDRERREALVEPLVGVRVEDATASPARRECLCQSILYVAEGERPTTLIRSLDSRETLPASTN